MKKNLFLTLLLAMFMVSCSDNVMNDFEETTTRISRSTEATAEANNVSRYTVRVRNLNPNMGIYVHWEVTDPQYMPIDGIVCDNTEGMVTFSDDLVGYFDVAPGKYVLEAVAENLGHIAVECEFNAENGGEILLELEEAVNGWQTWAKWTDPVFIPAN